MPRERDHVSASIAIEPMSHPSADRPDADGALSQTSSRAAGTPRASGVDRASAFGSILLGALAASMIAGRFETAGFAIAVGACAAGAAGARWPRGPWFVALAWGAGLAIVLNLYLMSGPELPLPRLFGAPATEAGLSKGLLLAARLVGAAIALHGLRAAWPGERAADEMASRLMGLERLGVRVRSMRALIGLALRFAPMLAAEHRRMARLQDLRAGGPPRTLGERFQRIRAVVIPTVVASIETAERVTLGLEARHYRLRAVPRSHGGALAAIAGWVVFGIVALWRA